MFALRVFLTVLKLGILYATTACKHLMWIKGGELSP